MTDKPRKTLEQMRIEALSAEGKSVWVCQSCGCADLRVTNLWITRDGNKKRLRKCRNCSQPVSTCELPVPDGFKLAVVPIEPPPKPIDSEMIWQIL